MSGLGSGAPEMPCLTCGMKPWTYECHVRLREAEAALERCTAALREVEDAEAPPLSAMGWSGWATVRLMKDIARAARGALGEATPEGGMG